MSNITFQLVTADCDKRETVNVRETVRKIYEEAFPESERAVSLDGFIDCNESAGSAEIFVVAALDSDNVAGMDSDNVAGMVILLEKQEYVFVFFMAVNSRFRGKGYGSRIMNALFEYYSDRTIIFDIETPVPESPNYEQRIKRQEFFEGLGCINTGVSIEYGKDRFTLYCNKMSDKVKGYFRDYFNTCINLMSSSRSAIPFDKSQADEILKMLD